jgi:hypothetical protein
VIDGFKNTVGGLGVGIRVASSSRVRVIHTSINHCYDGIKVVNSDQFLATGCSITDCTNGVNSSAGSDSTYVADCHIIASTATGETGVYLSGVDGKVTGCQIFTNRANNTYTPGFEPAGIQLNGDGPYTVGDCTITGFYNVVAQKGGGVFISTLGAGGLNNVTVTGTSFLGCGFYTGPIRVLGFLTVEGCKFISSTALLVNVGIKIDAALGAVSDMIVSGCTFNFNSPNTTSGSAIQVSAQTMSLVTISNSTYFAAAVGVSNQRFVNIIASASGNGLIITGNSIAYPALVNVGAISVLGFSNTEVSNNVFESYGVTSNSYALSLNSGYFSFTGNTVIRMNGVTLSQSSGNLPSGRITSNTFDGKNTGVTTLRGINVTDFNTPLSIENLVVTDNIFTNLLAAVDFTNSLNTIDISGFSFCNNRVDNCRYGITTDADSLDSVSVSGNNFNVLNFVISSDNLGSTCVINSVKVCDNVVSQNNLVAPAGSTAIVKFSGASALNLDISGNIFSHNGDLGSINVGFVESFVNLNINDNTINNELNSSYPAIFASVLGANSPVSGISMSRNSVIHAGNTHSGVAFEVVAVQPNLQVRGIRMDGNKVTSLTGFGGEDGVTCDLQASLIANAMDISGISLCNNILQVSGTPVRLRVRNPLSVHEVQVCRNNSSGTINTVDRGISVDCTMFGFPSPVPSASAIASNIQISHNNIRNCQSFQAVYAAFAIPVINLSVDHNMVHEVGAPAGIVTNIGNIHVKMTNQAGFPTYNAATDVSVSYNKVSAGDESSVNYGGFAILLLADAALTTEGGGISVVGNDINRHDHNGIGVKLGYDTIRDVTVSGNNISSVSGQAITINGYGATVNLEGVSVLNNVIDNSNTSGGLNDATVEILATSGSAYTISSNRITKAHRRGIVIDGTGSTSYMRNIDISNNVVDYTSGADAEESVYVYWPDPLQDVVVSANNLIGGTTGVHVTGADTAIIGISDQYLSNVSIFNNNLTISQYGVIVTHQVAGGAGTGDVYSKNINVSGNNVISTSSTLAGVMVEQVIGDMRNISITNNKIDGNNDGDGVLLDSNEANVYSADLSNNSIMDCNNYIMVNSAQGASLNDFTVHGNQCSGGAISRGIGLFYMSDFANLVISGNTVSDVDLEGILVSSSDIGDSVGQVPSNLSVIDNSVYNSGYTAIKVNLSGANGRAIKNINISRNNVNRWNRLGFVYAVYGINFSAQGSAGSTQPVYGITMDGNNLIDTTHDYTGGFSFHTDCKTKTVSFNHNKLTLDNNTGSAAMDWEFLNTGSGDTPENFTFMGNIFRRTNGAVPTYSGVEGNFATFFGNIGSAANFWTNFAAKFDNGGAGTVLPSPISSFNIDDGTI